MNSTGTLTLVSPTLQGERFYALDAARAFALLIGIFFHGIESLVSFLPPGVWAVKDSQRSVAIDVFFYVAHVFRMQAFFLISGFFAHMLYHSKGVKGFLTHRAMRIGLPLVVFWPFIFGAIQLLWIWGYKQMGYLAMDPATAQLGYWQIVIGSLTSLVWLKAGFPLGHLWFLYMLLWFCAAVVIIRPLVDKWVSKESLIYSIIDKTICLVMSRWWGSVVLGLLIVPAMLGMKNGFGVDTPDHGLLPAWAPVVVYGFYFTFGWLLHRQTGVLSKFAKYWKVNFFLSLILIAMVAFSFFSVAYQMPAPGQGTAAQPIDATLMKLLSMVYNSLYGLASMTSVFAFLGIMLSFFSRSDSRVQYVSNASYWMYLIHLPVVVFFQILVAPYQIHWLLKVVLILLPSVGVLFLSYHVLVRKTLLGILLNGRKYRKTSN